MPVAIKIPPVLRESLGYEAESALVDVLNQIQGDQRNGFERSIEIHLQAFREYLDRRLTDAEAGTDKRFSEADVKNEKRFSEAEAKNEKRFHDILFAMEKRFSEAEAKNEKRFHDILFAMEKRFAETDVKNEKRYAELQVSFETKLAQNHASLIRWMFAFFIGAIFSLASLLFVYFQLLVKVKP